MPFISPRVLIPVFSILGLAGFIVSCDEPPPRISSSADPDSVFQNVVIPVLRDECEGCHFKGGEVYASLPFDDSRVIVARFEEIAIGLEGHPAQVLRDWRALTRDSADSLRH